MDDANVPVSHSKLPQAGSLFNVVAWQSLLSLPYLGFLDKQHPSYVATRKLLLSKGNPYYAAGQKFNGVGYAFVILMLSFNSITHLEEDLMLTLGTHGLSSTSEALANVYHSFRPMSHISSIFGTDDDQEILQSLYIIANVRIRLRSFLTRY